MQSALNNTLYFDDYGDFQGMDDRASGIARNADGIVQALEQEVGPTRLLMELTAGQGTVIGSTFEEMAELIERMQSLVGAEISPEQLAIHIRKLQEEWRTLHRGAGEDDSEEEERFKALANKAYEPCKVHFAAKAAQRAENRAHREALLTRLAEYTTTLTGDSPNWRRVIQTLVEARREWRQYAPVDQDIAEALNKATAGADMCLTRLPIGWNARYRQLRHPLDHIGSDGGAGLGSGPGMAIGAAYAGHLGVTTTSGPGVDLKAEAMGLAVSIELPLLLIDVQRGGPSTGLPTKTEAADLDIAMYGRHAEAPLPIVAAYDRKKDTFGVYFFDGAGARFQNGAYACAGSGSERIRGIFEYLARTKGPWQERDLESVLADGLEMLDIAAEMDSATGGFERVLPVVRVLDRDGNRPIPQEQLRKAADVILKR